MAAAVRHKNAFMKKVAILLVLFLIFTALIFFMMTRKDSIDSESAQKITEQLVRDAVLIKFTNDRGQTPHYWGGIPSVNKNQSWPVCPNCGKPQTFLAQIDTTKTPVPVQMDLPVLCFFVCLDCIGTWWDSEGPLGFSVLRFSGVGDQSLNSDLPPRELSKKTIEMTLGHSLPSWGCLNHYSPELSKLSCDADPDKPWGLYDALHHKISSVSTYGVHMGGYPDFFEEIATPTCKECGREMLLALQVYSENVDLLDDLGACSLYFFVCKDHTDSSTLRYQCE